MTDQEEAVRDSERVGEDFVVAADAPLRHACVFRIAEQKFALDVRFVGEVIQTESLTPVPLAPPGVLGMYNLRGTALTVIDLSQVMQLGADSLEGRRGEDSYVLVLRLDQGMTVGAVIDRVDAVTSWEEENLKSSDAIGEHRAIRGVLDLSDRDLVASLLDGEEIGRRLERVKIGG